MIRAHFVGDRIISNSQDAFALYEKSRFGEKKEGRIEYSHTESLFLVSEKKMEIYLRSKKIGFDDLMRRLKKDDKKIETKFFVYSDLKKKGYIIKTALKFGAEFRIYDKGVKPGESHAKWILQTFKENEKINWHDFSAKARVAHSTKKNLLIALLDEEGDVTYYEVGWAKA